MVENGQKWLKRSKMAVFKGFWSKRAVLDGGGLGGTQGVAQKVFKVGFDLLKVYKKCFKR